MPLPPAPRARPFSHYQVALVLLAMLPLIVVFGVMAWWQNESLRESINHGLLRTADALSLAADREIGIVRASLEALSESDALERRDWAAFYREAARVAEKRPGSWIVIVDGTGQQLVNTTLPFGAPLPNPFLKQKPATADTLPVTAAPYVRRVLDEGVANNSDLFISLLHKRPVITVSVPVLRNGSVAYVLSMTLLPDAMTELLRAGQYSPAGGAALMDRNGFIITRSQNAAKYIGTRAAPGLVVPANAPERGIGTGETVDGLIIHRAYVRSPVTGWIVSNGVVKGTLTRQLAAELFRTGAVGLLGLGAGILLALWFARRLRSPLGALAAKAVGEEPGPVRGFVSTEYLQLARAIDAGAHAREAETKERELRIAAEARKEEADAANRGKDHFLAMLGHELRNPLAAISNAASVMQQAPAATASMTAIVKRQSEHLRKLVDDLLDVARVTSGKIRLVLERVDLLELARTCVDNFVATGRTVQHELSASGEAVFVHADRHRMTQVLTNLVDNALKFTPPGGRVTVNVAAAGPNAVLRVADTGAGIAPESLAHIFDVFAQGEQSLERGRTGLGLGLSLAKSLVEMQRGTIQVASDGLGAGAAFTITLPRAQDERPGEPGSRRELSVKMSRKRVLLVEDQADTRAALRQLLELAGHDVTEAADGLSAIRVARSTLPQIALVDLGLPDIDGFEVARAIRSDAALRGVRLVALTGYGTPEDREKAIRIGFDVFCVKPIDASVLKRIFA